MRLVWFCCARESSEVLAEEFILYRSTNIMDGYYPPSGGGRFDHGGMGGFDGGGSRGVRAARSRMSQQQQFAMSMHDSSPTLLYDEHPNHHGNYRGGGDPGFGGGNGYHQHHHHQHQQHYGGHGHGGHHHHDDVGLRAEPKQIAQPVSKPGVSFCSAHDAVSAKIAAFGGGPSSGKGPSGGAEGENRIMIAPGVTARLRGAKETWACIEQDAFLPTQCFCCEAEICCIMDASYVLCPACKVVSPLENGVEEGGVGLGFTFEDLQKWQYEILLKRQQQGH